MPGPDHAPTSHPLSRRVPGLDGLRAVAVAFVFLSHVAPDRFPAGFLGVDLFFVLSGYLITSLLLQEVTRNGRIDIRAFYLRRARRLFPALIALVVVVAVVWWSRGRPVPLDAAAAATYLTDLYGPVSRSVGGPFAHTWSLAVEEQFYLIWPALLVFSLRRRIPPVVTVVLLSAAAAVAVVPALAHFSAQDVYYSPLPHVCELGAGVVLALWLRDGRRPRVLVDAVPASLLLAAFAVVLTLTLPWSWWFGGGFAVVGIGAAVVVGHLVLVPDSRLSRVLSAPAPRWLGLRSYGFYLWHYPVLLWLNDVVANPWWRGTIGLAISLLLTAASWRFVELPFLRGSRHGRSRRRVRTTVAVAGPVATRSHHALDRGRA